MGGNGGKWGGGYYARAHRGQNNVNNAKFPGVAGAQVGYSSLSTVGVGWGVLRQRGGIWPKSPPPLGHP